MEVEGEAADGRAAGEAWEGDMAAGTVRCAWMGGI